MVDSIARANRCVHLLVLLVLVVPSIANAQDTTPAKEDKTTGLPSMIDWTFNFDAAWGAFGFGNSLFTDPKQKVPVDFGQRWFEGYAKPALSGVHKLENESEVYGKLSVVGERTYAETDPVFGPVASSFLPEDLAIGWRSGKSFERFGENALDFSFGRQPYTIGRGMLLWDGSAEGGSRGGYWTNARKAFVLGGIARFKPAQHTVETFYLLKDDLPEHDTETRVAGTNYEYKVGEHSTFGVSYMRFWADSFFEPQRNGENVINLRAYTAPIVWARDLSFAFEYARERNGDLLESAAWTAEGGYTFRDVAWTPKLSYRYAIFEGDDPATPESEAFDSLLTGFSDWGWWWQGEIAGEYFLSNSNLISHLVRVSVAPTDRIGTGVMLYKFLLDQPATYAPGVTSRDLAFEADWYMDWKINGRFTASFVAAYADPQTAVQQSINRTKSFRYGMVFLAYSY